MKSVQEKIVQKKSVLFLCTGNSARSQMAEALLKQCAADQFDVYSAGTHPEPIDDRTIEALTQFGIDPTDLYAKHSNEFTGVIFDYVITLCDKANSECRSYPNAKKQLAWDFSDPKTRSGNMPFSDTLNEINNRLAMFLKVEEGLLNQQNKNNETLNELTDFDVISFYKSLTDNIRLKSLMLANFHGELCVCELMEALEEDSQPKVSRNLALLKKAKIITDRKHGQWVFYRINPDLPLWAKSVIALTAESKTSLIATELSRLDKMKNRPNKDSFCK